MIEVENLTVNYDRNPVLWDLSFTLPRGILCGILGPNGAGKSTLLKALLGLVPALSGHILLMGQPFSAVRDKVAYVPQKERIDWDFPISVFDVVLMGRVHRFGWLARPRKADLEAVWHALDVLGMRDYARRHINALSGGQQQRLFLARALVQDPELLLMDEPFIGIIS